MGRTAFTAYALATAGCLALMALSDVIDAVGLAQLGWIAGPLLTALLPLAASMRFKELGWNPIWPLLPGIGVVVLLGWGFASLSGVGGASDASSSSTEEILFNLGVASALTLLLMALFALFPRSLRFERNAESEGNP